MKKIFLVFLLFLSLKTISQNNPSVSGVVILGSNLYNTTVSDGNTLTGDYVLSDSDNDKEGNSTYLWYRGNNIDGSDKVSIGITTKTYNILSTDVGKYLFFQVTPYDDEIPSKF